MRRDFFMDRSREMRRGSMAATSNGVLRRRQHQQRSSSSNLRDSPEDDGVMEMQETTRLRDRGGNKKERERLSRSKRRRGDRDRLLHASNRGGDDGGEDSSEDSLDDDEDDEDEEIRMPPPHPSSSSTFSNHHHHDLHHRKTFPPMNKVVRAAQYEMGFSVPRKARSASAKRSHEWNSGGGGGNGGSGSGGGEQIHRQASTSPARPVSIPAAPASPSSSSASLKKKLKPIGPKQRPPKVSKPAAAQDEIEIEVAEVLYGLMRQTSRPESSSQRLDSKEMNGSTTDCRSRVSSPISVSQSSYPSQKPSQNSGVVAPKRKKPRAVKYEDESSTNFPVRNGSIARFESEQLAKADEGSGASPKLEKNTDSLMEDNGGSLQVSSLVSEPAKPEIINNPIGNSKPLGEKLEDKRWKWRWDSVQGSWSWSKEMEMELVEADSVEEEDTSVIGENGNNHLEDGHVEEDVGSDQIRTQNDKRGIMQAKAKRNSKAADYVEAKQQKVSQSHLYQQLSQMKSLCNNILVLMNKYASSQQQRENNSGFPVKKPLDLMPLRRLSEESEAVAMAMAVDGGQSPIKIEEEERPRLFGVPIGAKRSRREEDEQEQEREHNGIEVVKSEPLDSGSSQHDSAWMGLHVSRE